MATTTRDHLASDLYRTPLVLSSRSATITCINNEARDAGAAG
jgi:hypothetical protein